MYFWKRAAERRLQLLGIISATGGADQVLFLWIISEILDGGLYKVVSEGLSKHKKTHNLLLGDNW